MSDSASPSGLPIEHRSALVRHPNLWYIVRQSHLCRPSSSRTTPGQHDLGAEPSASETYCAGIHEVVDQTFVAAGLLQL